MSALGVERPHEQARPKAVLVDLAISVLPSSCLKREATLETLRSRLSPAGGQPGEIEREVEANHGCLRAQSRDHDLRGEA